MPIEKVKLKNSAGEQVYPEIDPNDKGTEVSANPETVESDPELTGLMIGSNKYKVPSGGGGGGSKYYLHNIHLQSSAEGNLYISAVVISSSNEQFTLASFAQFLYNNGYTDARFGYPILKSRIVEKINGFGEADGGLYSSDGSLIYVGFTIVTSGTSLSKTVRQITSATDTVYEV